MHSQYLGDAIDFWKQGLLSLQRHAAPERRVRMLPMFTDRAWLPAEVDAYARMLGGVGDDVLVAEPLTVAGRASYFVDAFPAGEDVFVDPDIGVGRTRVRVTHVQPDELLGLLAADNLVAVYQHRVRDQEPWLPRWIERLWPDQRFHLAGYDGGQVGMIWLTRAQDRIDVLLTALRVALGNAVVERRMAVVRPRHTSF